MGVVINCPLERACSEPGTGAGTRRRRDVQRTNALRELATAEVDVDAGVGRMLEAGLPAYEAMAQMLAVTKSRGNRTRVLIASLRDADQLCRLSEMGHDCFTIAASVADMLLTDDRSLAAVAQFEDAAAGKL